MTNLTTPFITARAAHRAELLTVYGEHAAHFEYVIPPPELTALRAAWEDRCKAGDALARSRALILEVRQ